MNKKLMITLGTAALVAGAINAPVNAAAKKPAAKPAAKGKAPAKGGGKAADLPSTPHKWTVALGTGYGWQNSDVDASQVWSGEVATKIKKRQTVGILVNYTQNDLQPRRRPNRQLDTMGIHLSWLVHTSEDNKNRQPGFYAGFGPSLLMADLDTVGKETEIGWHARLGVDFKSGLYSELLMSDTKPVQKFNNAKLGGVSISAGYRWSL